MLTDWSLTAFKLCRCIALACVLNRSEICSLAITHAKALFSVLWCWVLCWIQFWPLHEAADTRIFREGSPVWGFPNMGESGRGRISDISSFDPPKMQRSFFLSKDHVTNHNPLRRLFFPFPPPLLSMWSLIFPHWRPKHKHVRVLLIFFGLASLLWVLLQFYCQDLAWIMSLHYCSSGRKCVLAGMVGRHWVSGYSWIVWYWRQWVLNIINPPCSISLFYFPPSACTGVVSV